MTENPKSVSGSLDHEAELQCPITVKIMAVSPIYALCNLFPCYNPQSIIKSKSHNFIPAKKLPHFKMIKIKTICILLNNTIICGTKWCQIKREGHSK